MNGFKILKGTIGVLLVLTFPIYSKACDHNTVADFGLKDAHTFMQYLDTIPIKVAVPESATNKPTESIIKEVPKARNQPIPIPVNIKVIPIKIIKPKIIKPIIKIL
jgi:hypothetical protein